MIVEINLSTGQENFIGGYQDLIKHFEHQSAERKIQNPDGES
jgi:hypothetical protein